MGQQESAGGRGLGVEELLADLRLIRRSSGDMGQVAVENGAKQILNKNDKGGFTPHSKILQSVLLADDVNKPVIVISVTGPSGKGKSFILDMMLRYLRSSDWIDSKRGSFIMGDDCERHTTGIMIWSYLFPVTLPSGEEAVIVLMDTQGVDDEQTDTPRSQAVQALASLISSLQIFNVMDDLSDDVLEQLRQSIEFGRMLTEKTDTTAFQKLMFLVRDWTETDEFPLGAEGGDKRVTKWLQDKTTDEQLQMVRDHIGDCFTDVNGFLLPYPGTASLFPPEFHTCNSGDMAPEFVAAVKQLVQEALAPENLTVKSIAGNRLKASELCAFITDYFNLFSNKELPKPEDVVRATIKANLEMAARASELEYYNVLKCFTRKKQPAVDQDEVVRKHKEATAKAEETFRAWKKIGDTDNTQKTWRTLKEAMDNSTWLADVNAKKRKYEATMAEKKKRQESQKYIIDLVDACVELYTKEMQKVVKADCYVPEDELKRAHAAAKDKAMDRYDVRCRKHTVPWDSRFKLANIIGIRYRLFQHHNGIKTDVKARPAARANMKGVEIALQIYRKEMIATVSVDETDDEDDHESSNDASSVSFSSDDEDDVNEGELQRRHLQGQKAAFGTFTSFQKGEKEKVKTYLDTLNRVMDEEFEMKKQKCTNDTSAQRRSP